LSLQINVIDTFKRVDFNIDVQRALHFFDGAILVLSGVSGVQRKSTDVDQHMKFQDLYLSISLIRKEQIRG